MNTKEKLRRLRKACREQRKECMEFIDILRFYGDRKNYSWRTAREVLKKIKEREGK